MANVIKIKKGLDIRLAGAAPKVAINATLSDSYAIVPDHFHGFTPRLAVQVGDRVQAGSTVLTHKRYEQAVLVSPVSGEIVDIKRGAKRKIIHVEIKADPVTDYKQFNVANVASFNRAQALELLLSSGFFSLIKQRPYDIVPDPNVTPRDIYISGNFTAPLMPNALELIKGDIPHLQLAIDLLRTLTDGQVHVGLGANDQLDLKGCKVYNVSGAHPAGNVGVLINHTNPINKGEVVWTLNITELALLGRFLATGKVDLRRTIVLAGSRLQTAGYCEVISGTKIMPIINDKLDSKPGNRRIIDGDVLTGAIVAGAYEYLSPFSNIITVIPEGDDVHEMFGWAAPGFDKFSSSPSFPSFLLGKKRVFDIDARLRGGERAMIVSGEYDRVFPMDIFPEQLLKSIISFDIDRMEELGIYEVAPEDFALCEFVDTSKNELQYIVRKGLDLLYKEMN